SFTHLHCHARPYSEQYRRCSNAEEVSTTQDRPGIIDDLDKQWSKPREEQDVDGTGQDLLVANSNHGPNSLYNHTDDYGETEREESPLKSGIGPESSDKDEG
ncbi:hypothetical protein JOM56_000767, partial [Amanita muscaria]